MNEKKLKQARKLGSKLEEAVRFAINQNINKAFSGNIDQGKLEERLRKMEIAGTKKVFWMGK